MEKYFWGFTFRWSRVFSGLSSCVSGRVSPGRRGQAAGVSCPRGALLCNPRCDDHSLGTVCLPSRCGVADLQQHWPDAGCSSEEA